jgi:hypothetical protein
VARLNLNKTEVRRTSMGAAVREVREATTRVWVLAKVAAKGDHPATTTATGRLSLNIFDDFKIGVSSVTGRVGVHRSVKYALAAHDGARSHVIAARRAKRLRFYWKRRGVHVTAYFVHHPGMRGKKYLTGPLVRVCVPRGFKVVTIGTYVTNV